MPLGMEVGVSPGDFVLDGDPSLLPKKGRSPIHNFCPCLLGLWPNGWMDEDGTCHRGGPWSRPHRARWVPSFPPQKRGLRPPQFSAHLYWGQTAGCIKMPLGMEVGDFVLDGEPAPYPKRGADRPNFRPTSIVVKRLHRSRCHLVRR